MAAQSRVRRQIRSFVLIWTLVTVLMGAVTFAAVYIAYPSLPNTASLSRGARNVALPVTNPATVQAVVVPTNTALPTRPPTETPTAAPTQLAVTEVAPTDAPPTAVPTLLPVEETRFEVGIQVQVSYDLMDMWLGVVDDQLGLEWVKQQVRWEDIEAEQGEYDWSPLDTYLPAASERGLKVLISVVTAPDWAREPGADLSQHGPPADPAVYADFVGRILERYPGMVHAVEVWNEMNLDREWTSVRGIRAADYVTLLQVTHDRIKSIDPGVIVVSGALSPTGVDDGYSVRDDSAFMGELIQAGMLEYTDCVGAHHNGINVPPQYTYDTIPNDPSAIFRGPFDNRHRSWSFRSTLQAYSVKIASAGGDEKLCVTEFGWASAEGLDGSPQGFDFARDNTLEEQRDYIVGALDLMREWDTVRLAFIWNLNYGPQAGYDPNNDNVPYSLIGPETTFRPAFDGVRDWYDEYEDTLD